MKMQICIYKVTWFLTVFAAMREVHACKDSVLLRVGLTCQEKTRIVNLHNEYRQSVALHTIPWLPSTASNMLEMTWDHELAKKAQDWANNCKFEHDDHRFRDVARFHVGQNLAITWASRRPSDTPDFAKQIKLWFEEVKSFHGAYVDMGHFTQLAWGNSHLVGCGYTYYYTMNRYKKLYVCNYGPSGNAYGLLPFSYGPPVCTLYGTRPSVAFNGLCAVHGYYNLRC